MKIKSDFNMYTAGLLKIGKFHILAMIYKIEKDYLTGPMHFIRGLKEQSHSFQGFDLSPVAQPHMSNENQKVGMLLTAIKKMCMESKTGLKYGGQVGECFTRVYLHHLFF